MVSVWGCEKSDIEAYKESLFNSRAGFEVKESTRVFVYSDPKSDQMGESGLP